MRTTFGITFLCRESKKTKNGYAPIELSIVINGERCYLTLPRKEIPSEYKKKMESKRGNELKDYIESFRQNINAAITDITERGLALTASLLREYVQNGGIRKFTVQNLFDEYFSLLEKRIGVSLQQCVYDKYVLVRDKFYGFVNKSDSVSVINNYVITSFYTELQKEMKQSTVAGYMTKLKTVVLYALDNGYLKVNPFSTVKIVRPEEKVECLTENEISMISSKDFGNDRLSKVRDLFLFQCFSGLSYADMSILTKEDIQVSDNTHFVSKNRVKTKVSFTAVILNDGVKILEKYDYQLPTLSNQKYNSYLKEIADLCGIVKPLHSHIGRHTYATLCLNKGVRLEILSKMLGHSNVKQTQHYAKLINNTIFEEVTKAFK